MVASSRNRSRSTLESLMMFLACCYCLTWLHVSFIRRADDDCDLSDTYSTMMKFCAFETMWKWNDDVRLHNWNTREPAPMVETIAPISSETNKKHNIIRDPGDLIRRDLNCSVYWNFHKTCYASRSRRLLFSSVARWWKRSAASSHPHRDCYANWFDEEISSFLSI